jgi:hypothetical protein
LPRADDPVLLRVKATNKQYVDQVALTDVAFACGDRIRLSGL